MSTASHFIHFHPKRIRSLILPCQRIKFFLPVWCGWVKEQNRTLVWKLAGAFPEIFIEKFGSVLPNIIAFNAL